MSDYTTSGYPVGVGYDANGNAKVFKELSSITITGGLSATTISATNYLGIAAGNLPTGASNDDILYWDGAAANWTSPTGTALNLATTSYVATALEPYATKAEVTGPGGYLEPYPTKAEVTGPGGYLEPYATQNQVTGPGGYLEPYATQNQVTGPGGYLESYIATSVISDNLEMVYNNGGALASLTLTHPVTSLLQSDAKLEEASNVEITGLLSSNAILVYNTTATAWENKKLFVYTNATDGVAGTVEGGNLEFRLTNAITSPPGTTGDSDLLGGFVYVSGANASSTTLAGDEFGRTWVTGPNQDISTGSHLVYWSATTSDPATSGTAAIPVDLSFTPDDTNKILRWDGNSLIKDYNDQTVIAAYNTGSTITKGQAVYVSGPHAGGPNIAEISLARADADATMPSIGLALEDIPSSEEGSIVSFGTVIGLNTSAFTEGDVVYVSPSIAGGITTTKPTGAGDQIQNVGIVIKSDASNGSIKVTGVGRANAVPNRNHLLAAGLPVTIHSNFGAPVASSNSTSLTEVTSITIPSGTLTDHSVEVEIRGRVYGQGQNLRMSFDLGGTTILNSQISQGTASVFYAYTLVLKITRTGDDTQFVTAHFSEGGGFNSTAGHGGWSSLHREGFMYEETSATEGSDLALDFNVQHSANASGENFTIESVVARIIPA